LQPVSPRREARERDRSDLRAAFRDDVANPIGLELLREGALLLDVLPFAGPKRLVHILGAADVDDPELAKIDARLMAGILEHREGLAASEKDHLSAFKALPRKVRIGCPAGDEEPVHLVDLRKMNCRRRLARGQGCKGLAWSGLDDIGPAFLQCLHRGDPGRRDRPFGFQPFGLQEPTGHHRDKRRVESREQRELDVDAIHSGGLVRDAIDIG
jgi:hypothetical protein